MSEVVLTRVTKQYGAVTAVRDFSLTVRQGELVALLGPSGCGKTTTLRMIAGFIPVTSGSIAIGDRDVTHVPPHRRNTGMVFQGYALFPHMTVAQNVAFGLEMRKVPKAEAGPRVEEALRLVRLQGYGERYPRQLSGGQQQRVALARALVVQPEVFLLDEPLSNLDAKLRHDVRLEIRSLQQDLGLTTVFVTHDQEEALTVADRLIVMNRGVVEQVGTPEELYERPRTRFVADFIGKSNFFEGRVEAPGLFRTAGGAAVRFADPAPGAEATLAVRPEKLRLEPADAAASADNVLPGRVEVVTFLGATIETIVRLDSGERVTVHGQNRASVARPEVGDRVGVAWDAAASLVLAADAALEAA
jgi:putative spermidine/putrescine transport system ATP-binding protein